MITERLSRSGGQWAFAVLASLLILSLQAGGGEVRAALQFERVALQAGEWYRLLTAHWVHTDWNHALMNAIGLCLLGLVDAETRTARRDLSVNALRCVVLSVVVSLALYWRHPRLDWYLGLSGVLHGLFTIVLIRAVWRQRDPLALLVLAVLMGKLVWEHYHGALTQDMLSMPVIVAAHSYGALGGVAYVLTGVAAGRVFRRLAMPASNHQPED